MNCLEDKVPRGAQLRRPFLQPLISALVGTAFLSQAAAGQPPAARQEDRSRPAPRPITPGTPVTSEIDEGDAMIDGSRAEEYAVTLAENEQIQIEMDAVTAASATPQARTIDPYLLLYAPGNSTPVARNDDRGNGSYNSRLVYAAPAAGTYVLRARGFASSTGRYRLTVTRLPPARDPIAIDVGRTRGTFGENSPVNERAYRHYEYLIRGDGEDRIGIEVGSEGMDITLQLTDADGNEIASTEGFGGLMRPRLYAMLLDDRPHRLRVEVPMDQAGDYTLDLARMGPPEGEHDPEELRRDQPETASLALNSPVEMVAGNASRVEFFYRIYRLRVRADETVVVTLESPDFDPVLDAGRDSVIGYALAASDNDGGGGFNSRLELHPVLGGVVHLRVRSRDPGVGAYTLRVLPPGAPPPPQDEAGP